jgi:hypothetical protein
VVNLELDAEKANELTRASLKIKALEFKKKMLPLIAERAEAGYFTLLVEYESDGFIRDEYLWKELKNSGYKVNWGKENTIKISWLGWRRV